MIRRTLTLLFTLVVLGACAGTSSQPRDYPALWKIDKAGGGEVWIFGTIHRLPAAHQPRVGFNLSEHRGRLPVSLPPLPWYHGRLRHALNRMQTLWLETIESVPVESVLEQAKGLGRDCPVPDAPAGAPGGRAIGAVLERFDYTERAPNDAGALLFLLSELQSRSGGTTEHVGVEYWLARYARDQRRRLLPLESIADRARAVRRALDGVDCPAKRRLVLQFAQSLNQDLPATSETRSYDIWRRGAMDELARELKQFRDAEPHLFEALVTQRNRAWLPVIRDEVEQTGIVLVAVGMAHLAGPNNLIELLRETGIRVERVQ